MQFVTTSALRQPRIWSKIRSGKTMVTKGGRPIAIVLPVTEDTFEDTLEQANRLEALQAVRNLQAQARAKGSDRMTPEEIDAEIKAARKVRRARRP